MIAPVKDPYARKVGLIQNTMFATKLRISALQRNLGDRMVNQL